MAQKETKLLHAVKNEKFKNRKLMSKVAAGVVKCSGNTHSNKRRRYKEKLTTRNIAKGEMICTWGRGE